MQEQEICVHKELTEGSGRQGGQGGRDGFPNCVQSKHRSKHIRELQLGKGAQDSPDVLRALEGSWPSRALLNRP